MQNDTNKELENNEFRTNNTDINDKIQLLNNNPSINGTSFSLKTKIKQNFQSKRRLKFIYNFILYIYVNYNYNYFYNNNNLYYKKKKKRIYKIIGRKEKK